MNIIHTSNTTDMMANINEMMRQGAATAAQLQSTGLTLGSSVVKLYRKLDATIASVPAMITCKTGCDYCCHYRVLASAVEILAIADHVRTWPATRRDALIERLAIHSQRVAPLSVDEHLHTNIPCPLLVDHCCSAYALRPLACRGHHEARSVETCKETFDDPASPALGCKLTAIQGCTEGVSYGMAAILTQQGQDANQYELGTALYEAMTNPACAKRFRSGRIAFPSVRDRELLQLNGGV